MADVTFGDKIGSKVMTLKPFSYLENNIVVFEFESCYYIFIFGLVLIIHTANKLFQGYINISFSPLNCSFVYSLICVFVHLSTFRSTFCNTSF